MIPFGPIVPPIISQNTEEGVSWFNSSQKERTFLYMTAQMPAHRESGAIG